MRGSVGRSLRGLQGERIKKGRSGERPFGLIDGIALLASERVAMARLAEQVNATGVRIAIVLRCLFRSVTPSLESGSFEQ